VKTAASIVIYRVSLSVCLQWLGWTEERREDMAMYLGSGYRGPMSSSSSFFCIREHPNWQVTTRVCKRFGKGSLWTILRLVGGEIASPAVEKKDGGEELSMLLSGLLSSRCRAQSCHEDCFSSVRPLFVLRSSCPLCRI
jgi:hypothetical protein